MWPSLYLYSNKARRALEKGIDVLSEAVGVTLGSRGRNVVLGTDFGAPQIINDGVTTANAIELENHIENTGVSLIRQAAAKTNDAAGDGTTTAIVLASAMVKEGLRNVVAGANPIGIRDGIEKATHFVVEQIKVHACPVEDSKAIAQVGTISAGNDASVVEMIATAMSKVGNEGVITLEEGKSMTTELEITEGMRLDQGYIYPYFMTETEMKDRKYKLEDAINATKAAVEEGIVPGGGTLLAHVAPQIEAWATEQLEEEERTGALIVSRALYAPMRRIVDNAGQSGAIIAERLKEHEFDVGYDAVENKFVDMFQSGIVDPAKVTRSTL